MKKEKAKFEVVCSCHHPLLSEPYQRLVQSIEQRAWMHLHEHQNTNSKVQV